MSLHDDQPFYAEFTVIQRHILQFRATDEKDALEQITENAGQLSSIDGLQVLDSDSPVILLDEMGPNEDGPFMYDQAPFSVNQKPWMEQVLVQLRKTVDGLPEAEAHDA